MRLLVIILGLILSLSMAGCSDSKSTTTEKKNDKYATAIVDKKEDSQSVEEEDSQPVEAETVEAEETFEEIPFKNVNWFLGTPDLQVKGGGMDLH